MNYKSFVVTMLLCIASCAVASNPQQANALPEPGFRIYCKGACPDKITPCIANYKWDNITERPIDIICNCNTCQRIIEPLNPEQPMPKSIKIAVDMPLLLDYATTFMSEKHLVDKHSLGINSLWYLPGQGNYINITIDFVIITGNGESYTDAVSIVTEFTDESHCTPKEAIMYAYSNSNGDPQCCGKVDLENHKIQGTKGDTCGVGIYRIDISKWQATPDFFNK